MHRVEISRTRWQQFNMRAERSNWNLRSNIFKQRVIGLWAASGSSWGSYNSKFYRYLNRYMDRKGLEGYGLNAGKLNLDRAFWLSWTTWTKGLISLLYDFRTMAFNGIFSEVSYMYLVNDNQPNKAEMSMETIRSKLSDLIAFWPSFYWDETGKIPSFESE